MALKLEGWERGLGKLNVSGAYMLGLGKAKCEQWAHAARAAKEPGKAESEQRAQAWVGKGGWEATGWKLSLENVPT